MLRVARTLSGLGSWAPFIVFALSESLGRTTVRVALCIGAFGLINAACLMKRGRATRLDLALAVFWAGGTAEILALGAEGLQFFQWHFTPLVYLSLIVVGCLPVLLGKESFTLAYAKRKVPTEFWNNPVFLAINLWLNWIWCGSFVIAGSVSLLPDWYCRYLIPLGIVFAVGVPANRYFPQWYLRKHQPHPNGEAQKAEL